MIASSRAGGIGEINPGTSGGLLGGYSNIIRNNRIGVGVNGENIAPDPADPENARAVGIAASAGDQITGNIIANFGGSGISVRTLAPPTVDGPFPPTVVTNNQISNCGIGVQVAQISGASIANNQISNCSRAGVVVADRIYDISTNTTLEVLNPFNVRTRNVTVAQNSFQQVGGPGIALTAAGRDVFENTYQPNTRTSTAAAGPNLYQPSPVLTTAQRNQDNTIGVNGMTNSGGRLELYASSRPALPGAPDNNILAYGLGSFVMSVEVSGGPFSVTIPADKAAGMTALTATVTVAEQTSEFARTVAVQGSQPPVDTVPPTVTVTAPAAGTQIESKAGTQVTISWQSSDNVGVNRHNVFLSRIIPNGIPTNEPIATGLAGNVQAFTWSVPENLDVPQALIGVEALDAANNQGNGISGMFTIKKPIVIPSDTEKPVVSGVTLSKKKVKRSLDPSLTITWQARDNVGVTAQDVLYATDGVNFSLTVMAGLPGTAQSFAWTVPSSLPKSKLGVVKIIARDAAGNSGEAVSIPFVIKK